MQRLALVVSVGLLACSSSDVADLEPPGASPLIVNGQLALGDPAVVALTTQGQVFCTATLITPSIVLSASHCLPPNIPYPVSEIAVLFGSGPTVDELIPAHSAWAHPAWNENALYDDIGLLQMKSIANATPIPLNTQAIPVGTDVRLVGFGVTGEDASDSGTKREGVGRIAQSDVYVFDIDADPSSTCYGDSGGPTLSMEDGSVAGVHSRGSCGFSSLDMRVDGYLSEIQTFIDEHPEPSCAADGLCAAPCEGGVDPDCPCAEDGECAAQCPDLTQDPDCAQVCGPDGMCTEDCAQPDPDCPSCAPDGHCVAGCVADPDCSKPACDPAVSCCDDDCNDEEPDEPLSVDDGCACRVAAPPRTKPFWALGLIALAAARSRIRTERRLRRPRGARRGRPALR